LLIFIGANAETEWLLADIARNARGYVLTGIDLNKAGRWSHSRDPYLLETSVPGVFACGDVRLSPVKRVASAVGEGSMAIAFIHSSVSFISIWPRRANRSASGADGAAAFRCSSCRTKSLSRLFTKQVSPRRGMQY
jgi:hypothetical protein